MGGGGVIKHTRFYIKGNNNIIRLDDEVSIINGDIYIDDDDNEISIGRGTNLCGKIHIACTEGKKIKIGKDCLFSSDIVFRTGDSHSLLDMRGNRINFAKDIIIGEHVWIGHKVCINKGVIIPPNCIVGTGAVVTKPFEEENVVIAGVPASIAKRNVNWRYDRM